MIELSHITKNTDLGYKSSMLDREYDYSIDEDYFIDESHWLFVAYYSRSKAITYSVVNTRTGKVTLVLSTIKKGNYELINVLQASNKNKLPAHIFYSFLIKKLNKILVSGKQSPGGMAVWRKMAKVKGITINGWDFKKNTAVNTDKLLKEVDDLYITENLSAFHQDVKHIHLVASVV